MHSEMIVDYLNDHVDADDLVQRLIEALEAHGDLPEIHAYKCWVDHPGRLRCLWG